ncbi:MAG TPA: hypothetical protein VGX22_02450 [Candidatus Dormibacteraeota bacterium]|nr:hypothetical protein [Candidatus Dormibacteraeota bacterium]
MKRLLLHRLWIIGALAGIIVIAGAVRAAATPDHSQVHLVVASSSGSVAQGHLERPADATPEAVENEAAENEAAEEANEANEAADEANEPAENENEQPAPTAPPTAAPPAPPATSTRTFSLTGGTVTVTCSGNAIMLNSAMPNAGFTTDKEEIENGQVEVRFQNDAHESRLEVMCANGTVVVEELREESS